MRLKPLVLEHFRKHLGKEEATLVAKAGIEVLAWADPDDADVVLLLTVGMSEEPMVVPKGLWSYSAVPRVELLMYAKRREIGEVASLVRDLADYPGKHETFVHWNHVVRIGIGIVPDSELTALYFSFPGIESDGFATLKVGEERVDVLWVVPITEDERGLFESQGAEALEALLEENDVVVSDLNRRSVSKSP